MILNIKYKIINFINVFPNVCTTCIEDSLNDRAETLKRHS